MTGASGPPTVIRGSRLLPRRPLRSAAAALAAISLVLVASAPGAASGERTKVLPGSAFKQVARAHVVGRVASDQPLSLVVSLKPRNEDLLESLAARSSGRKPLDPDQLRALFLPADEDVAAVRSYLQDNGFQFRSAKGLALFFAGQAGAAEHAFGVDLVRYRDALGRSFRAPNGPLSLPPGLVGKVAAVDGLDTAARYRPAAELGPNAVTPVPACSTSTGPTGFQSANGGYLPADLAAAGAYDYQALLDGGYDGGGESIAFVEFSNYRAADVTKFRTCFNLATTTVSNVNVNGGTLDQSGGGEVALDLEVALAAAPGLDNAYVYIAPNTTSMAAMINQIVSEQATTNVHIISISWGLCEQFLPPSELSAVNSALQLAAAAGMSVFAASGDNGSSDCLPDATGLSVDDPASQPYATGVGGTNLDLSGPRSEVAWNSEFGGGGGGLSAVWPMPSWQSGVTGPDSSGDPCGVTPDYCRHVPDVALSADPENGYIIYCLTSDCGYAGWLRAGGTSAGAPLLAAMTADANEYSLAQAGERLGFASPFLYDRYANGGSFFVDVDTGSNDYGALGKYSAAVGYDLATGLGSLDADLLAQDLATYSGGTVDVHATEVTASPTVNRTITSTQSVAFSGDLMDTTDGVPIAGRAVWIQLTDSAGGRGFGALTDANGHWSRILPSTSFRRSATWKAYYLGDADRAASESAAHKIYVVPRLTAAAKLRYVSGHYVVRHGVVFTFTGTTRPNMAGAIVVLQWRAASSPIWRSATTVHVGSTGAMAARGSWGGAGRYYMRWRYSGSTAKPWLAANSPAKLFVVS